MIRSMLTLMCAVLLAGCEADDSANYIIPISCEEYVECVCKSTEPKCSSDLRAQLTLEQTSSEQCKDMMFLRDVCWK